MDHSHYPDSYIEGILNEVKTIAMVGSSGRDVRPSYFAMQYLQQKGYRVIPVNPTMSGQLLLGETVYGSLSEIPDPVDMVDIFRRSEEALAIAEETLAMDPRPKVLWMQLTVENPDAAALAEAAGMKVVMDRCPKIEYGRLSGEISWMGVNSRTISSKRPILRPGYQKLGLRKSQT